MKPMQRQGVLEPTASPIKRNVHTNAPRYALMLTRRLDAIATLIGNESGVASSKEPVPSF